MIRPMLVCATAALVMSCQQARQPTEITDKSSAVLDGEVDEGTDEGLAVLDCQATPAQCDKILRGINELIKRPDAQCSDLGKKALARFQAATGMGYGRVFDPNGTWSMSVRMEPGKSTPTGWGPTHGYVGLRDGGRWESISDKEVGGMVAHEEVHMLGEDADGIGNMDRPEHTRKAYNMQLACMAEY